MQTAPAPQLHRTLVDIVQSSDELMAALAAVRALGLASWCIGAGAVRALVWDRLHGYTAARRLDDVDVVYFEPAAARGQDAQLEQRLQTALPHLAWDVTNQAHVHHWFLERFSEVVAPLASVEDGVATWPEYATCVGVSLAHDDTVTVVAPHGLHDLFAMVVRHNPARASKEVYRQRVGSKRLAEHWPQVSVIPA